MENMWCRGCLNKIRPNSLSEAPKLRANKFSIHMVWMSVDVVGVMTCETKENVSKTREQVHDDRYL